MAEVKITMERGDQKQAVVVANSAGTQTSDIEVYINNASYTNDQLKEAARDLITIAEKLQEWGGSD